MFCQYVSLSSQKWVTECVDRVITAWSQYKDVKKSYGLRSLSYKVQCIHFPLKKRYVSEVFCCLSSFSAASLELSMKIVFISWKEVLRSGTVDVICSSAPVTMGYSFSFSVENLSDTVPCCTCNLDVGTGEVSSFSAALALTVLARSQRQRGLTPNQTTSRINIT